MGHVALRLRAERGPMCYASGLVELHGRVHAMCPRQPVGVGAASRGRSMRLPHHHFAPLL